MQNNPLAKHFRQPAIYFQLPSKGQYWTEGSLEMPLNGELPIYPMTAKDEITLRTPDALLNGQGIVSVLESCVPNIKSGWGCPSIDLDALLIAIRIASYGQSMEMNSKCTHCDEENKHEVDLSWASQTMKMPDYNRLIIIDGLKIKLQPQAFFEANKQNMIAFEEQKILQVIGDQDMNDQEKLAQFNFHMEKLIDNNLEVLANSTESISTSEGDMVTHTPFILDFYRNADGKVVKAVRERVEDNAKEAGLAPMKVKCDSCEKEYDLVVEFNYSSFFGQGS